MELALKNSLELKNARQNVVQAEEMRDHLSGMRTFGYTPVGPGYTMKMPRRELLTLSRRILPGRWRASRWGYWKRRLPTGQKRLRCGLEKLDEIEVSDLTLAYAAEKCARQK